MSEAMVTISEEKARIISKALIEFAKQGIVHSHGIDFRCKICEAEFSALKRALVHKPNCPFNLLIDLG